MPLPWISVHTTLPTHPKSFLLGVQLGDPRAWTYPLQAWLYAAEHAADGVFRGKAAAHVFEHAAGWAGERGILASACIEVGFLEATDEGLAIHDWEDHAGAHIEKLERDAARQRKKRALLKRGRPKDVTRTSAVRHADVRGEKEIEIEREIKTLGASAPPRASAPHVKPAPETQPPENTSSPPETRPDDVRGTSVSRPVDVTQTSADTEGTSTVRPPPVRDVTERLVAAYSELRGEPYVHGGAKDTKALKRVIAAGAPTEEIERRWRLALELGEEWPGCSTLAQLASKWNDLGAHVPRPSAPTVPPGRDVGRSELPAGTCEKCGKQGQVGNAWGHLLCEPYSGGCYVQWLESETDELNGAASVEAFLAAGHHGPSGPKPTPEPALDAEPDPPPRESVALTMPPSKPTRVLAGKRGAA